MNESLYSLVYCSRNRIHGEAPEVTAELKNILEKSRINNGKVGITGALLYTSGTFAQVLEGPMAEVERIFEKIQRDSRHGEVLVLHMGPASERLFPAWSMAFAGNSSENRMPLVTDALNAAFANPASGGEQVISLLHDLISQEDNWSI